MKSSQFLAMKCLFGLLFVVHQFVNVECIDCADRHLYSTYTPTCNLPSIKCEKIHLTDWEPDSYENVEYISRYNHHNNVHVLFSTIGVPSILLIRGPADSNITVDWVDFLMYDGAVNVTVTDAGTRPLTAHGIRLNQLFRFNDVKDEADISLVEDPKNIETIDLSNIHWDQMNVTESTGLLSVKVCSNDEGLNELPSVFGNGSLCLTASFNMGCARDQLTPRLQHSPDSVQVDVELIDLSTDTFGKKTRFAFELMLMSSEPDTIEKSVRKSIDDEFTPGVFKTVQLTFGDESGYVTWKPVCYKQADRQRQSLTHTTSGPLMTSFNSSSEGLLYGYFGNEWDKVEKRAINVTLGYPKDKFYSSSKYLVWSLSFGLGASASDEMSMVLMLLIGLCAILSLAAILCALVCALVLFRRRAKRSGGDFAPLVDDDFSAN